MKMQWDFDTYEMQPDWFVDAIYERVVALAQRPAPRKSNARR